MSKLGDVRSMYGQDLGIGVTNAPTNILKQYSKLTKNMLLISSPQDDEGNDIGIPSILATDYNGNLMQLTYAIYTINGLYPNGDGLLQLNIDNKSIKEEDKHLYVDTNNLTYCSFNNLGVAKVSKSVSSRTNSAFPIDTFISVDKNGVLYLSDTFLTHIYQYVANKIYDNLYPLIMDNIKGWLVDGQINYYPADKISILPIDVNNGIVITKRYQLQYNSPNEISEEVAVDINNNDYPIKEIIFDNNTTNVSEDSTSTKEIKIYRHSINFSIVFYPNYNLQNSLFLDNQYQIKFRPQSFDGSNNSLMFYFNQNNAFDNDSNVNFKPFSITTTNISLNQLKYNRSFEFLFDNQYMFFEDVDYNLQIYYIKSENENNLDDAILLIDNNINDKVKENYSSIMVDLENTATDEDNLDSNVYNTWKNCLITVNDKTEVITKLANSSNLYKYVLTYTINGERSYVYSDTFRVNYQLTNIYKDNNYYQLEPVGGLSVYTLNTTNSSNVIQGGSLINNEDYKYVEVNQIDNKITIHLNPTNDQFLFRIFNSIFPENSLSEDSSSGDNILVKDTDSGVNTGENESTIVNNPTGFLLIFNGSFTFDVFITNGGENNDQEEFTIYDSTIPSLKNNPNVSYENGKYYKDNKEIIFHKSENVTYPKYTEYFSLLYPNYDVINNNAKSLKILTFIRLEDFMKQSTASSEIKHSSLSTNLLKYNLRIYNAQGPTNYIELQMDYVRFISSRIKIFSGTYGHWDNEIQPGVGSFTVDSALEEIKSDYSNHKFFVGIDKTLIDEHIFNSDLSVNFGYTYKNIDGSSTSIKVSVGDPREGSFGGSTYKLFEINYVDHWYKHNDDYGTDGHEGESEYILNPTISNFDKYIRIEYKWKNQSSDSPKNIFDYYLNFNITGIGLNDPTLSYS